MGTNYYLDQRRTEYANTSDRLAAMQRDVEADTANIIERTNTAQQVIADDKRQIAEIEKHMKEKTMEKKQAEKQLARIDKNIEVLNRDLKNMNEKVSLYRDVADAERKDGGKKSEVQRLDRQIDQMNVKVAVLQKEVDDLYSMRSAVTLG
jgi:chromosome segregation ATPase